MVQTLVYFLLIIVRQAITKLVIAVVLKHLHFDQNCRSHQTGLVLATVVVEDFAMED